MERQRQNTTSTDAQVRIQTNNLLAIEARIRLDLDADDLADRLAAIRLELAARSQSAALAVVQ